ncbi:MAG: glycosyltransferase [Catenulispora sp.]
MPVITYGVLSTYPPTKCGLETFSAALLRHLNRPGARRVAAVVRVASGEPLRPLPLEVVADLRTGDPGAAAAAATVLNRYDVAIVQHEYGIYGGPEGEQVLDVLARVRVPVIGVLHTVEGAPSERRRDVLKRICERCDTVVVLSQTAARRLPEVYGVAPDRIAVVPHGAETGTEHDPGLLAAAGHHDGARSRPLLLTWGLIGPGKGIEWAIDALAELDDLPAAPRYVVAGQTHPNVLRTQGEAYREALRTRAAAAGVGPLVEFDATYRGRHDLAALVASADIVLLPYESGEQVASGVLIEAVAAQRPIIATAFPHAVELLSDGAGLLVPQRDPHAMAEAIRRVLTEPGLAEAMTRRAGQLAPAMDWEAVTDRYRVLAARLTARRDRRAGLGDGRVARREPVAGGGTPVAGRHAAG